MCPVVRAPIPVISKQAPGVLHLSPESKFSAISRPTVLGKAFTGQGCSFICFGAGNDLVCPDVSCAKAPVASSQLPLQKSVNRLTQTSNQRDNISMFHPPWVRPAQVRCMPPARQMSVVLLTHFVNLKVILSRSNSVANPQAVPTALRGAFQSCGQNCAGAERFIVQRAVYPAFVRQVVDVVRRLRQGPPLGGETVDCGAMCLPGLAQSVERLVKDAVEKGATVSILWLVGGDVFGVRGWGTHSESVPGCRISDGVGIVEWDRRQGTLPSCYGETSFCIPANMGEEAAVHGITFHVFTTYIHCKLCSAESGQVLS
jgi:hypothetical protein